MLFYNVPFYLNLHVNLNLDLHADFRMGISKSDLVLRNSLLHVSKSLENISVR